jgi:hypothetical protein
MQWVRRVRTGTFGINQGYTMDPFAPFGGVKSQRLRSRTGTRRPRQLPRCQIDRDRALGMTTSAPSTFDGPIPASAMTAEAHCHL